MKIRPYRSFKASLVVGTQSGYKLYAIAANDGIEKIFETGNERVQLVERLFSSSLVAVVYALSPCTLRVCHFKRGSEICSYSYSSPILSIRLNRLRLVVCLENGLYIHNIRDMKVLHRICDTPQNPRGICALSASSSGTDGYLAYPGSCQTGEVQVFDAISLRAVTSISAHNSSLAAIAFNSQGILLATASEKGTVIRVFSFLNGNQKLFEFRRGVKRCATIHSLAFSADSSFLACTSNTETVHAFHLEAPAETLCDDSSTPSSQSWMSYFGQALRTSASYLPTQVSDVFTQSRDYAIARLPTSGVRSACAVVTLQKLTKLLVATDDGWLYVFSLDPLTAGSECVLLNRHRIDGSCSEKTENSDADKSCSEKTVNDDGNVIISKTATVTATDDDAVSTVTSSPSSTTRLSYAAVASSSCRRDGPQEWPTCEQLTAANDNSFIDDGGFSTPAEELQAVWSSENSVHLHDDQQFPAISRHSTQ